MIFDATKYQPEALIDELLLIERHCKDGSAAKAKCACIQEKHMRTLVALAKESVPLMPDKSAFFHALSDWGELRLQSIYHHIGENPSESQSVAFYDAIAVESRDWRSQLLDESFKAPCGCLGCVPCLKK